jgi:drug/metabolite transporter (DMT)-like permease
MNPSPPSAARTAPWVITVALVYLYIAWGTTYLAIKQGVHNEQLPPALFGGTRVCLAGLLLLAFLAWRGRRLRLTGRDLGRIVLTGIVCFVGGNGMLTFAERTVPSGVASVLAATTPIWVALLGWFWPQGERLGPIGWLGLLLGLAGVVVLVVPELWPGQDTPGDAPGLFDFGPLLMMVSTLSWALGILLLRHAPTRCDHLVSSAYQMAVGGGVLTVVGVMAGEMDQLPAQVTVGAVTAFLYLLVFGSLLGYVAFNFLLRHVSAALVGTHAYVNPLIAILVGWALGGEQMSGWIAAGMLAVLVGVLLVRSHLQPGGEKNEDVRPGTDHPLPHPEREPIPAQR